MSRKISFLILAALLLSNVAMVKAETDLPDLVVNDLSVADEGGQLYVKIKISNIGAATINGQIISVKVEDLETGDVYTSGQSNSLSGEIEIISAQPLKTKNPAEYELKATVDHNNIISESDENNNTLESRLSFDAPSAKPDLVVNDLTVADDAGQLYLKFTISNNGAATESGQIISVKATDLETGTVYTSGYSNSLSGPVEILSSYPLAIKKVNYYKLKAEVDHIGVITESNENNNILESSLSFDSPAAAEKPDLKILNVKAVDVTSEALTIQWQANGSYDCTMIYSTKDSNLDDDRLVSTRDADDYIWGSNFPKSNSQGIYKYEIKIRNQGSEKKYFAGDKKYYYLICYDGDRNKVTSAVESFVIPSKSEGGMNDSGSNDPANNDSGTDQLVLRLQRQITALEKQVIDLEKKLTILDKKFAAKHAGTMFLDVENNGRLWYVDPASNKRFYFENGKAALSIGSKLATGITYEDIQKIPVGVPDKLYNLKDSDNDGLPDRLESALGSDPNKSDSDGDGYNDKQELKNGYDPVVNKKYSYNQSLVNRLEGKMLLQVAGPNSHGEIWYIKNGQRWYGGTEDSMYEIMKARSLGAVPGDIRKIEVGGVEGIE